MENNLNSNENLSEVPLKKMKWETPQLVFISSGSVKGGNFQSSYHEASFVNIGRYYDNPVKQLAISEADYNNINS